MSLKQLCNRRVLVLDIETSDLPMTPKGWNKYYPYRENQWYDKSRIIEVAWYYDPEFDFSYEPDDVHCFLRKPTDFDESVMHPKASDKHGIAFGMLQLDGISFANILGRHGLGEALYHTEFIVGHNIMFDMVVVKNEINRLEFVADGKQIMLNHLDKIVKYIDTQDIGTNICKLPCKKNPRYFKVPSLLELHEALFGTLPENQHRAKGDVLTTLKCIAASAHNIPTKA